MPSVCTCRAEFCCHSNTSSSSVSRGRGVELSDIVRLVRNQEEPRYGRVLQWVSFLPLSLMHGDVCTIGCFN